MKPDEVKQAAAMELHEEKFRAAIEKEKSKLKWPWYRKLWPYMIQIKVIDLREQ